jgi:hypothetical protein
MTRELAVPLAPFVDPLPLPSRLIAAKRDFRLTVRIRAGEHRFHREMDVDRVVSGQVDQLPDFVLAEHREERRRVFEAGSDDAVVGRLAAVPGKQFSAGRLP